MEHFAAVADLDTFALTGELWARRHLFDAITLRQEMPHSAHRETRAIFLRGPEEPTPQSWFDDVPHLDYRFIEGWASAAEILARISAIVGAPLGKVMIVALKPGGRIVPHIDEGAYAAAHDRYHLPLVTNPLSHLISGGERLHVPVGALTWFDTAAVHSAENLGPSDRIHLIVDARKP